jgi:XTP/dITP diphosphohydrolase
MTTWVLATRSPGKLAELRPMIAAIGIHAVSLDDVGLTASPDEDGIECFSSFEANAIAKARYFAERTGLPCLADDSGLCIDALGGAPGVRSRRFALDKGWPAMDDQSDDAANNDAMLDACRNSGVAPPWPAQFVCAAAYVDAHRTLAVLGQSHGAIHPDRDGTGGFGYDPYFMSADLGVSFARASRDEKAQVSHRGRAFATLLTLLADGGRTARDG